MSWVPRVLSIDLPFSFWRRRWRGVSNSVGVVGVKREKKNRKVHHATAIVTQYIVYSVIAYTIKIIVNARGPTLLVFR